MNSGHKNINYGAIEPDEPELGSEGMIPAENLCPFRLLAKSWGMLAPVLGPLFVIVTLNAAAPHDLTMDCENHHEDLGAIKLMCALTLPGVRLFPRMGIILGLLLLAWRMTHERGYYCLMKNKVMVDLDAGKRFGFWVIVLLGSLFTVACLHLILKLFAGHPCTGDDICDPNDYMFKNNMSELLMDPRVFSSQKNYQAQHFLSMAVLKFVVPGVVCISSLGGLLNLENELIPLSKLLEKEPAKAYRNLGDFVYVPEQTLRTIIREDEEQKRSGQQGLQIGQADSKCELPDLARALFEEAQKRGCIVLGSTAIPELAQESPEIAEKVVNGSWVLARVKEIMYIDWWPVKILVNTNLTGKQSRVFKQMIGIHYCGTILAILLMASLAIRRFAQYGSILFHGYGSNWAMIFPELMLIIELSCQFSWLYQALKYTKYAIPDPETVEMVRNTVNAGVDAGMNMLKKDEAQEDQAPLLPETVPNEQPQQQHPTL